MSVLFTEAFDVWYETLALSINLTVDSFAFCWLSVGVCFVERTVLGSGCLVGLCEGDLFLLQGIQV